MTSQYHASRSQYHKNLEIVKIHFYWTDVTDLIYDRKTASRPIDTTPDRPRNQVILDYREPTG